MACLTLFTFYNVNEYIHLDHFAQLLMPESIIMHIDTQSHRGLLTVHGVTVNQIIVRMSCVS